MTDANSPTDVNDEERGGRGALLGVALVVLIAAAIVIVLLVAGGDDDEVTSTPTTSPPTTVEEVTTTTSAGTTTTTEPSADLNPAVWPEPASGTRFDDPVAAARSFAVDFVGFTEPVVGAFLAGDSRSGEVPVQATEQGPVTTVLVRQLADDGSWWVIGSATPNIEVDEPSSLTAIDSPLHLAGRARAFEGNVNVEIRADGQKEPLVQDFVTGRGDGELGPFEKDVTWPNPGGGWGSVVFTTHSAEDGRVWEAAVIRVGFIGGD